MTYRIYFRQYTAYLGYNVHCLSARELITSLAKCDKGKHLSSGLGYLISLIFLYILVLPLAYLPCLTLLHVLHCVLQNDVSGCLGKSLRTLSPVLTLLRNS